MSTQLRTCKPKTKLLNWIKLDEFAWGLLSDNPNAISLLQEKYR
jgi:hypothetical protein